MNLELLCRFEFLLIWLMTWDLHEQHRNSDRNYSRISVELMKNWNWIPKPAAFFGRNYIYSSRISIGTIQEFQAFWKESWSRWLWLICKKQLTTNMIQSGQAEAYTTRARTLEDTVPSLHRSWNMTPIHVRTSLSISFERTFLLKEARDQQIPKKDKATLTVWTWKIVQLMVSESG